MRESPNRPVLRFGENLRRLIDLEKTTVAEVAKKVKLQPKQIYNLMKGSHDPRLKGLEKVANVFGLSAWQLLAVDLTDSPADNKQILALLEAFSAADADGRRAIMQVAELAAPKASR